jgi:hypothetical protein
VGSLAVSCVSNVREQLSRLLQSAVGSSAAAALQVLLPSDTHPSAQVRIGLIMDSLTIGKGPISQ